MRINLVMLAVALLLGGCANQQTSGPPEFSSKFIAVSSGGLMGVPGGKPMLHVTLENKSAQTLWVKVRIAAPSPNSECVMSGKIESGAKEDFHCVQVKVVPETDYPVFMTVYLDQRQTEEAEAPHTKLYFGKADTMAFEKFMMPPALPVTFKGVRFVDDPDVGTALFGSLASSFAGGSSVLVVKRESLEYTDGDKSLSIPISDIRKVGIEGNGPNDVHSWVQVEYIAPAGKKKIGFQANPFSSNAGTLTDIAQAIRYAVDEKAK